MSERREVHISGGTFALCMWLFFIWMTLRDLVDVLQEIASKMP